MRPGRVSLRATALVAVFVMVAAGCGNIKERKERADLIISSVDRAIAHETAMLTFTQRIELNLDELGERAQALGGGRGGSAASTPAGGGAPAEPEGGGESADGAAAAAAAAAAQGGGEGLPGLSGGGIGGPIEISQPGVVDLANDRVAMLFAQPGAEPFPITVFNGTSLYVRRTMPGQEGGGGGVGGNRPWARVDLGRLDPDDIDNSGTSITEATERLGTTQAVASPLFLLRLLRGTLSGSVEEEGTEEINGVKTTHYSMNVDREKATEDEPEAIAELYEAVFKSMFVNSVVVPAEVWLDEEGLPRRFSITFEPKVRRRSVATMTMQIDFREFDTPITIAVPPKKETVRIEGLGALANLSQA